MKRNKRHLYRIVLAFEECEDDTFPIESYDARPETPGDINEVDLEDEARLNDLPWREVVAESLFAGPCDDGGASYRASASEVCAVTATMIRQLLAPLLTNDND